MIIRRPYAFFIKNFRKIHVLLILMSIVILFKQTQVSNFTKEFIRLQTYDPNNFPITKYIPAYILLLTILVLIGSIIIAIVLQRKNKPWRLYLIPIVTYITVLIIDFVVRAYFIGYNGQETSTEVSLYRDVLIFSTITQYISIGIFILRVSGLDLRKFNFKLDEEYLELDEEDQEEIEININIDKHSFSRTFNRLIRNLGYIYQEHKKICIALFTIIGIIILRQAFVFIFINNKVYKQNDEYQVNGYTFIVKNAYYTDKNSIGEKISNTNSFVVIELSIKNNVDSRILNADNFHLLNGIANYSQTSSTYGEEFEDLGKVYDRREINTNKTIDVLLIYRVSNDLKKNRFVLSYQERGLVNNLRKIKLNIEDLSKIKKHDLTTDKAMKVKLGTLKEKISIDDVLVEDKASYTERLCNMERCENSTVEKIAPQGKKIMIIDYGTEEIESKELIDFSTRYGKIIYIDSKNKEQELKLEFALDTSVKGKTFYALVPADIVDAKKITLNYTIRNNSYNYKIELI
ncbi:MAG: hypothetical protein IJI43_04415 [Bacilli bacterium]|nr:hypothetical protein [Bacilli bacterium]